MQSCHYNKDAWIPIWIKKKRWSIESKAEELFSIETKILLKKNMLFYIEYAEHESKHEERKEEKDVREEEKEREEEEEEALLKHGRKEGKRKENKQDRMH